MISQLKTLNLRRCGYGSRYIIAFSCIIPVVAYYYYVLKYTENIPFWDDFYSGLSFIETYLASGLKGKLTAIFSQHNEHRIVFSRIMTIVAYKLQGAVDFKTLNIIGNAGIIGIAFVLYKTLERTGAKALYFLPVILMLFQPQHHTTMYQATSSLANIWMLFFSFASLHLLLAGTSRWSFVASLAIAVTAMYTNGNGLLTFVAGALMLILQGRKRELSLWGIVAGLSLLFYFNGYVKPGEHPGLSYALNHPLKFIEYFLNFIASPVYSLLSNSPISPEGNPIGTIWTAMDISFSSALIAALLYFILSRRLYRENPSLFAIILFLIGTIAIADISRLGFGVTQSMASRYKLITVSLYSVLYMSSIQGATEVAAKKTLILFLALSIPFSVFSYRLMSPAIKAHRDMLISGISTWESTGTVDRLAPDEYAVSLSVGLSEAVKRGIYIPPALSSVSFTKKPFYPLPAASSDITYYLELLELKNGLINVRGWAYIKGATMSDAKIYLVFASVRETYIFETIPMKRPDVSTYFNIKGLDDSGFSTTISEDALVPGRYRAGVYIRMTGKNALQFQDMGNIIKEVEIKQAD